jgi:Zn-dependent metalloprotease
MSLQRLQQNEVCHVIPPHILRHIAEERGEADPDSRAGAAETLVQMEVLAHGRESAREKASSAFPAKRRNVYDAQHKQTLPGKLVLSETATVVSRDVEVREAFDGAGKTYDFFASVFKRNSIDGKGLRIDSSVHYGKRFENAFWNGRQMVYGDGDGKYFKRFTAALDVIGHELTHGVTQYEAGLAYTDQTGALNEHVSDAFGIMVKQATLGLTAETSDWIIGEGLFGPTVNGKGIRSMKAPGTAYDDPVLGRDPQPAHMRDYVETTDDNGGVHLNSGIPNHAFYLAAVAIGGTTWNVLGQVWYRALHGLSADADFVDFAKSTISAAGSLFGVNGKVQRAVEEAWLAVGVMPPFGLASPAVVQLPQPVAPWPCLRESRQRGGAHT